MGTLILLVLAQAVAAPAPASTTAPVAIVISSRRDADGALSAELCETLKTALAAEGIAAMGEKESNARLTELGAVDSRSCDGSKLCLAKLSQLLQGVVIGVDIGKVQKFSAAHLEAVASGKVDSVAVADFTADAKGWQKKSSLAAGGFAKQVAPAVKELNVALAEKARAAEAALKGAPGLDAPRQTVLAPEPPPTPPPSLVGTAQSRSYGPAPYVFTVVAGVAAIASVTFLILGMVDKGTYDSSLAKLGDGTTSSLNTSQLDDLAKQGNVKFSVSLGCGIAAAGFAGLAAYFFSREP